MKIHLGEFTNLINNAPVFAGDTISHGTMTELVDIGFATRNNEEKYVPTEEGRTAYRQLLDKRIEITTKYSFKF